MNGVSDHPALMNGVYRHQRHIYDLTRRCFLLGRDRLLASLGAHRGEKILEIGCGTARNLIVAARLYPEARLFGIDISTAMLETAARNIAKAGLRHRIVLAQGDAGGCEPTRLFRQDGFERVFLSYSLSMIPPWREALDRAAAAVPPGGRLHVLDFGGQEGLPPWFRRALRAWLAEFHVSPRLDLQPALERVARERAGDVRVEVLYRGYAVHAELRRQVQARTGAGA